MSVGRGFGVSNEGRVVEVLKMSASSSKSLAIVSSCPCETELR